MAIVMTLHNGNYRQRIRETITSIPFLFELLTCITDWNDLYRVVYWRLTEPEALEEETIAIGYHKKEEKNVILHSHWLAFCTSTFLGSVATTSSFRWLLLYHNVSIFRNSYTRSFGHSIMMEPSKLLLTSPFILFFFYSFVFLKTHIFFYPLNSFTIVCCLSRQAYSFLILVIKAPVRCTTRSFAFISQAVVSGRAVVPCPNRWEIISNATCDCVRDVNLSLGISKRKKQNITTKQEEVDKFMTLNERQGDSTSRK